jgi:hypothetical protein
LPRNSYERTARAAHVTKRLAAVGRASVSYLIRVLPQFLLCIPSISRHATLESGLPCTVAARLTAPEPKKEEIAMNPTARAVVFVLVILGMAASLAPGNLSSHNRLAAMLDGTQPPVPPKAAFFDGTQPPVPPKMMAVFARMPDGTQPPVPPKMTGTFARKLDGTQPPVPPKMTGKLARMLDGTQPPVPPKAMAAAV